MTRSEALKVFGILKAAYPNAYKGMTKDDANSVIIFGAVCLTMRILIT